MNTDYDAIRAQLVTLCSMPVKFGTPVPEVGYIPDRPRGSRDGAAVILRYTVPVTIGDYSTTYTYPVRAKAYYEPTFKRGVDLHNGWVAVPNGNKLPEAGDVLSCLLHDAQAGLDTFESFCSDIGYDTDSRKAFDIYLAYQKALTAMRRAFGDNLLKATYLASEL